MAELSVRSVLVTGANRGIGLGLVQHFLRMPKPPQWIFAGCRDPKGQRAQLPMTVDKSMQGMLKVLSSLSEKETGTFLDWEGKVILW